MEKLEESTTSIYTALTETMNSRINENSGLPHPAPDLSNRHFLNSIFTSEKIKYHFVCLNLHTMITINEWKFRVIS